MTYQVACTNHVNVPVTDHHHAVKPIRSGAFSLTVLLIGMPLLNHYVETICFCSQLYVLGYTLHVWKFDLQDANKRRIYCGSSYYQRKLKQFRDCFSLNLMQ